MSLAPGHSLKLLKDRDQEKKTSSMFSVSPEPSLALKSEELSINVFCKERNETGIELIKLIMGV